MRSKVSDHRLWTSSVASTSVLSGHARDPSTPTTTAQHTAFKLSRPGFGLLCETPPSD